MVLVVDAHGMARGVAPLVQGYAGLRPGSADRRRDPQQGRLGAPDRQASRGARALYRHSRARRGRARRGHRDPRAPPRPDDAGRNLRLPTRVVAAASTPFVAASTSRPVRRIAASAAPPALPAPSVARLARTADITVAVARDEAFGFYYPTISKPLHAPGAARLFRRPARSAPAALRRAVHRRRFSRDPRSAACGQRLAQARTLPTRSRMVCRPTPNAAA